ncbi:hypothetical protein ACI65C_013367 [Semiaphis heraclei]
MVKANASQYTGNKRSSSEALSPRHEHKNKYSPLTNLDNTNDDNSEETDLDPVESASSAKYYNLSVPPPIRRLKRGRPHDLLR